LLASFERFGYLAEFSEQRQYNAGITQILSVRRRKEMGSSSATTSFVVSLRNDPVQSLARLVLVGFDRKAIFLTTNALMNARIV
jgi:hypothetical protein